MSAAESGGRARNKRHRRGGGGDSVEDFHKGRAAREADRNAEAKRKAQEISSLLKDEKALREEIERLKAESEVDHASTIKALEANLARHKLEADKRLARREQESEIAVRRRLAAGLCAGPAPPSMDPPRRGPGFPPPRPPPLRDTPPPPPSQPLPPTQHRPLPPPIHAFPPPSLELSSSTMEQQQDEEEEEERSSAAQPPSKPAPKLFMPTAVAVAMKKQGDRRHQDEDEDL